MSEIQNTFASICNSLENASSMPYAHLGKVGAILGSNVDEMNVQYVQARLSAEKDIVKFTSYLQQAANLLIFIRDSKSQLTSVQCKKILRLYGAANRRYQNVDSMYMYIGSAQFNTRALLDTIKVHIT